MATVVTQAEGVMTTTDGHTWSNKGFVSLLAGIEHPCSVVNRATYHSPVSVTLAGNSLPPHWVAWDRLYSEPEEIAATVTHIDPIDAHVRHSVSRGITHGRVRQLVSGTRMGITPRGIHLSATPESIDEAVRVIVQACAIIMEKATTTTMQHGRDVTDITSSARLKAQRAYNLLHDDLLGVVGICALNPYVQPAPLATHMFFCIAAVIGMEQAKRLCDETFMAAHRSHVEQVGRLLDLTAS